MDGEHPEICLVANYLDNDGVVSKTPSNGIDVLDMEYVNPSQCPSSCERERRCGPHIRSSYVIKDIV